MALADAESLTWNEISKSVYEITAERIYKSTIDDNTGKYVDEVLANNLTKLNLIPEECQEKCLNLS